MIWEPRAAAAPFVIMLAAAAALAVFGWWGPMAGAVVFLVVGLGGLGAVLYLLGPGVDR